MITKFDRSTVRGLQAAVEAALKSVADKHGIGALMGSTKFNSGAVTFKVEMAVKSAGGVLETQDARDYRRFAPLKGLPADTLGKTFTHRGERFTIIGWRYRARRAPVLTKRCSDGKQFVFSDDTVRLLLKRDHASDENRGAMEESLAS